VVAVDETPTSQQRFCLPKIISGGQTGADQGALFAARDEGFETGGFAPIDFSTEVGSAPELLKSFGLKDSYQDYVGRTRLNVKEADITIWFGYPGTAGYYATRKATTNAGKPFVEAYMSSDEELAEVISKVSCVNIAGNRESHNSGIFESTRKRMKRILFSVKMNFRNPGYDHLKESPLTLLTAGVIISYHFDPKRSPPIDSFVKRIQGVDYEFYISDIVRIPRTK